MTNSVDVKLDLEQELQHVRAEIEHFKKCLATLDDRHRVAQKQNQRLEQILSSLSKTSDLDELVRVRVIDKARKRCGLPRDPVSFELPAVRMLENLSRSQVQERLAELQWRLDRGLLKPSEYNERVDELSSGQRIEIPYWLHYLENGILLSVHFLADSGVGDRRDLVLRLPRELLDTLWEKQPTFFLFALGSSHTVLVVPGADLWSWLDNVRRAWYHGEVRCYLDCRLIEGQVWLRSVKQARPWGRGEQIHVCRQESVEISRYLNRYDLVDGEEG